MTTEDQGGKASVKASPVKGPRLHHVAAHVAVLEGAEPGEPALFDEVLVFGTELEALRHIVGKAGWVYKALANGQQFTAVEVNGL